MRIVTIYTLRWKDGILASHPPRVHHHVGTTPLTQEVLDHRYHLCHDSTVTFVEARPINEHERNLLAATRVDPVVGRGTCSVVDECLEDGEVLDYLHEMHGTLPPVDVALGTLREFERLQNTRY